MSVPEYTKADVDMARFLAVASFGRKPRKIALPTEESLRRAYDHETERLRRFIRGRQNTNPKEGN